MKNSDELLHEIDSFYIEDDKNPEHGRLIMYKYDILKEQHKRIIDRIGGLWVPCSVLFPKENERVFTISDLTPIGKGIFVCDHYYQNGGFVANLDDTDPYGFITAWVSFDVINSLPKAL